MRQLVGVNLSVVGRAYECLSYAEYVFGAPHIEACAWDAWNAAQFKHTDNPPGDVAVPIWFSWVGTVDGVRKNWGHAAVYVPGSGVYCTPLNGTGHYRADSIDQLARTFGVQYVGWSEDISTLRVVGEDTVADSGIVTKDQIPDLVRLNLLREPNPDDNIHIGKWWWQAEQDFIHSPQRGEVQKKWDSIPGLEKQVADLTAENEQLKNQIATGGSDTVQLNALGTALRWLLVRLGLK